MFGRNRREFLADVGRGMLVAGLGSTAAVELDLARVNAFESESRLTFGSLEPLVSLLQETSPDRVLPLVVERLNAGTSLETLAAATALANARAFGGHDYTGYHTFMALLPAYQMAGELPTERRALPLLKVLHRNSRRIHEQDADEHDALHTFVESPAAASESETALRDAVRAATPRPQSHAWPSSAASPPASLRRPPVDGTGRHERPPCRAGVAAWAMLDLAGPEHAHSLLRQSVRFCIDSENDLHDRDRQPSAVREVLPRLLDAHRLMSGPPGTKSLEDAPSR